MVLVDFPGFMGFLSKEKAFHSMDLLVSSIIKPQKNEESIMKTRKEGSNRRRPRKVLRLQFNLKQKILEKRQN